MLSSNSLLIFVVAISCFSLVGINYVYSRKKKEKLFSSRSDINLQLVWQTSYSEFEYHSFEAVWIELASVMEVPHLKVEESDTIDFISNFSNSKELLMDEIERHLGNNWIKLNKISVNHTFGKIVKLRLEKATT